MKFCSVINCMDGRIQIPVNEYLQKKYSAKFVDTITEAGPNLILHDNINKSLVESILFRLKISVEKHNSVGIAIVGHYDCAGNPATKEEQINHIKRSIEFLKLNFNEIKIIGLWVNDKWEVEEVA